MDEILTVSEINKYIKTLINSDSFLNNIKVKGEISNLKIHTRGHLYFSLKDETSKINCVMFNYMSKVNFKLQDGINVEVSGKINVYEASGIYQIYVNEMREDGVGNLYQLFEQLKKKLNEEGLFNPAHKKKIPRIPRKIGVITAPTGAAVRDIISTINKRFPLCEIIIFPSLVQGDGAKNNLVKMLHKANEFDIDVIIIGRGGGSIEDLWPFNEEIVARAIYESKIPIISAVGHEIDYTISDFVADLRAPTPTGAAEYVVPDINEIFRHLSEYIDRIRTVLNHKLKIYNDKFISLKNNYLLSNPQNIYIPKEQQLDISYEKLNNIIENKLNNYNIKLDNIKNNYILKNPKNLYIEKYNIFNNLKLKLDLINPINILNKGYSIVKYNDKIISDIKNVNINDSLNIILKNGIIISEVKGVKENGK